MAIDTNIVMYNDLISNVIIQLPKQETWKKYSRMWGDSTHRICSYVAMFSPSLADYFINKYSKDNDIVLDTFSGRGTTLLQARLLGRQTYAIDLNPFAYVLSRAKSQSFKLTEVLERVKYWEEKYNNSKIKNLENNNEELKIYYSEKNLQQLLFIKENLGKKYNILTQIDNFILAVTLGLMHGPMRANGETIYFSLGMSNHTSMSSNYVKNYALKHNLVKPEDNIFEKISTRVKKILNKSNYSNNIAKVKLGNALKIKEYFDIKPKLIFTSPPYLNLINYTKQNWIKMWLLGFNNNEDNKSLKLDDRHNVADYEKFMEKYLLEISKICNNNTSVILVIGDANNKKMSNYFDHMWEKIRYKMPLKLIEIYSDPINRNKKATSSLGSKSGNATREDKIYVFKLK